MYQLASGAAEGARGGVEEEKEAQAAPAGSLQAVAEEQAAAEGAARQARVSFLQHSMATAGLQCRALTCPHYLHTICTLVYCAYDAAASFMQGLHSGCAIFFSGDDLQ